MLKSQIDNEFWKQFAGAIVRKLLVLIGGLLVSHEFISKDQSQTFSSGDVANYVVGAIFLIFPIVWQWAKTKYNINVIAVAKAADPRTSFTEVKKETLDGHKVISSV